MKGSAFKIITIGLLAACINLPGQSTAKSTAKTARDHRLEDAIADIALLQKTVEEQDRRIHELEKEVKSLSVPVEAAALHPLQKEPSKRLEVWEQITIGMSRAQVEDLLGKPTSADSVIDHQTLYYADPAASTGTTPGTVKFTDDRVTDVILPGR